MVINIHGILHLYTKAKAIHRSHGVLIDLCDTRLDGGANLIDRGVKHVVDDGFLQPTPKFFYYVQLRAGGRKLNENCSVSLWNSGNG